MPNNLEMYYVIMEPYCKHISDPHATNCKEYLTVIDGSVKVVAGESSAELNSGDFISYQGDISHSLENLSSEQTTLHLITIS